jgi:hypothetical protein
MKIFSTAIFLLCVFYANIINAKGAVNTPTSVIKPVSRSPIDLKKTTYESTKLERVILEPSFFFINSNIKIPASPVIETLSFGVQETQSKSNTQQLSVVEGKKAGSEVQSKVVSSVPFSLKVQGTPSKSNAQQEGKVTVEDSLLGISSSLIIKNNQAVFVPERNKNHLPAESEEQSKNDKGKRLQPIVTSPISVITPTSSTKR